jgi:hypothetical protein
MAPTQTEVEIVAGDGWGIRHAPRHILMSGSKHVFVGHMHDGRLGSRQADDGLSQRVDADFILCADVDDGQLRDGGRVDFSVTVQRDETGQWTVTAITGRFGVPGSMSTNYHAGGRVQSLTQPRFETEAKLAEAGVGHEDLQATSLLALRVAHCLQRQHANLTALGIDIEGSAGGKRLYVYDCNSRPGRDILNDEELQAFMRSVAGFARYPQGMQGTV